MVDSNMKKVLIMVIGCSLSPWDVMAITSVNTWDSIDVPNVETIFYFGNPVKENTDKFIYFPIDESYSTMSKKTLLAFEWALKNKDFDYIARINSSTYVDKKLLIKYIQTLADKDVFAGIEVESNPNWMIGWGYIISKDVIEKIVNHQELLRHDIMDDVALSYLINDLNIPYTKGKYCSIDKRDNGWVCISYGSESFEFTDWKDCRKSGHHFYRCKQDLEREKDKFIMEQLFKILK